MTPEESDYEEALRLIQEAEEHKSVELDLNGLSYLTRFPPELAALTSLQSALVGCSQLSGDLSPLAKLTSLQSLIPSLRESQYTVPERLIVSLTWFSYRQPHLAEGCWSDEDQGIFLARG